MKMTEAPLDTIEAVMAGIHEAESGSMSETQGEEGDQSTSNEWARKHIIMEDGVVGETEDEDGDANSQLDSSVKEEIKAALMAGQKTITLSADDASLEAKILEIVRQSRNLEQADGSQQQYIEIVNDEEGQVASRILATETEGEENSDGQRVVEIDLMNFKLVRYQDEGTEEDGSGHSLEGLVVAEHDDDDGQQYIQLADAADESSADNEAVHYIQNSGGHSSSRGGVQYVQVIEKDKVPLVYFTTEQPKHTQRSITTSTITSGKRKRGEFVLPPDAMASPNFKLYLYNCKLCDFKCNAIKELTAHKIMHPGIGAGRYRGLAKPPTEKTSPLSDLSPLSISNMRQYDVEHCTQCLYKTVSKTHLIKHIARCHSSPKSKTYEGTPDPELYDSYESGGHIFYKCRKCNCKSNNAKSIIRHKCLKKHKEEEEFALS